MYKYFLLCVFVFIVKGDQVTVVSNVGTVIGESYEGYNTFLGVPYAKVDEENPFANNIDYPHFDTPFYANDSSISCPQVNFNAKTSLQCLTLNIYVPQTANTTNKRPILVWFHEESSFTNAGQFGGQHLVKKDILVVTVNYRLGPYGFLCLLDPKVSGNQGLKDQVTALKWLKKNIAEFGGNPLQVTIAGGSAVDLHLYSEFNNPQAPLFNKVIVQSGSIFKQGFYKKPDYESAVKMATFLGFNSSEIDKRNVQEYLKQNKDALNFLAHKDYRSVFNAAKNLSLEFSIYTESSYGGANRFVKNNPYNFDDFYNIGRSKIMIGYTSMEQIDKYADKTDNYFQEIGDIFYKTLEKTFDIKHEELKLISDMIKEFYLGGKPIKADAILDLSAFSSDFDIRHAIERSIQNYLNGFGTTYKYVFSYTGGSKYKHIKGSGAPHGEELKYLFELEPLVGVEQLKVRDKITTLWANFVKFGNPTPTKASGFPKWTPVTNTEKSYLNIDVDLKMENQRQEDSMALFDLLWLNYETCTIFYPFFSRLVMGMDDVVNCKAPPPGNIIW